MKTMRIPVSSRLTLVTAAVLFSSTLAGCGLAETTAVTAAQAESAVQQAKEGKKLEEKVQRDIEAAQAAAAQQRSQAEAASE